MPFSMEADLDHKIKNKYKIATLNRVAHLFYSIFSIPVF